MVRISTIYDKINDKNEKVFMVRGDEAYARTTKVLLELNSNITRENDGYIVTATVDVLRDVGSSNLIFYDGDDEIMVADWIDTYEYQTYTLPKLSYKTVHELSVVYKGNNSCLASKSDVINISENNTNLISTSLAFINTSTNYIANQNIPINAKLTRATGTLDAEDVVFCYADDEYIGESVIDSNGDVSFTINGGLSNGKHNIQCVFYGNDNELSSNVSMDISVGYNISLDTYPSMFINGESNTISGGASDYLGNPITPTLINVLVDNVSQGTLSSNGTKSITSISNGANITLSYNGYHSNIVSANAVTVNSLEVSTLGDGIVTINDTEPIYFRYTGVNIQEGLTVTSDGVMDGTHITGRDGLVLNYEGTGVGEVTITGNGYNKSDSITIQDYAQYWKIGTDNIYRDYSLTRAKITEQSTSYRIVPTDARQYGYLSINAPSDYWECEFDLVSFSGKYRNGISINNYRLTDNNKNGDKIKVINNSQGHKVLVNDKIVLSNVTDPDAVTIVVNENTGTTDCTAYINNVKMKRLTV